MTENNYNIKFLPETKEIRTNKIQENEICTRDHYVYTQRRIAPFTILVIIISSQFNQVLDSLKTYQAHAVEFMPIAGYG